MLGAAKNSPTSRCIPDIDERIKKIERYIQLSGVSAKNIEHYIKPHELENYWKSLEGIHIAMSEAQKLASSIQSQFQKQIEFEKS